MTSLDHLQTLAVQCVEQELFLNEPLSLYEPVNYGMRQGGKRIRPLLVLLATDMFGGDIHKATQAAVAVEILHNFTLLHDDIMDKSPFRRGQPTCYKQFGTNAAILSGDAMFAMAVRKCFEYEPNVAYKLAKVLSQTSIEICKGQALDMDFEKQDNVTINQYLEMVRLKTSVLLGCSLESGAIIANVNAHQIKLLRDFGELIGIAFQIQDDVLDCWGCFESFGKVKGKDIIDNKKTFLYLKALEMANEEQKKELLQIFSANDINQNEKVEKVITVYDSLKIREFAENFIKDYTEKAMENLKKISVNAQSKENLITFANSLMKREK
ncbi:MAG: polyprenyl synthetase family protein [Bacteroidales bacterium]|nr:polyprenyl synthetase family protein [Bacteroidales bacterium]